jgi:polysaccharide chain length determinant protein (PEP-CTERM system associated)
MGELREEILLALHGIWRRRQRALLIAWGVCLAGWLGVSLIPNTYESRASVFVQHQSLLPEKLGITPAEQKQAMDGIIQTLTSAENLEKVVRETALGADNPDAATVAARAAELRKAITIVARQDNLFEISAEVSQRGLSNAGQAVLARSIVQRLLDLFVEGNLTGGRTETARTLRFLDDQLAQRERQLQEAEARRAEFEARNVGLLPGLGSASQRMEAARMELGQVESNLMAAQGALAALNGQLGTGGASSGGAAGASASAQIEAQLAEGAGRGWTEDHPDMKALRRQLDSIRAAERAGARPPVTTNPNLVSLRAMQAERQAAVTALAGRRAQLQAEMAQYSGTRAAEPGVAAEQQRLNRDYDVLKDQYDKLLADREEVRLRNSLQNDADNFSFRVIEPPSAPRVPVAPNRPLLLTLVLIAGVGAGCGGAFALGQLQTRYSVASRLERDTGIAVTGSISEQLLDAGRRERARERRKFAGGVAALFGGFVLLLVAEFVQRSMMA